MLSGDQLIYCIRQLYPDLQHGRDFLAGHPVHGKTFEQADEAFIMKWETDRPQPSADEIAALWAKHGTACLTDEAAKAARDRRYLMLQEADHMVARASDTGDIEAEKKARAYRQALRDVPQQPGFPASVQWPVKP
jgi:hypothetical protein